MNKTINIEYAVFKWLWLIILLPKAVQLVVLYGILFLCLSRTGFRCLHNSVSLAMLILSGLHLLAIILNLLIFDTGEDRFAAAMNTLLLWPLGAGYYAYYSTRKPDLVRIGKYCCVNLLILFLEAIIATLLYRYSTEDELAVAGRLFYSYIYLNGVKTMRFVGFQEFSNMNMMYAMLMYTLSVYYLRKTSMVFRCIMTAVFLYVIFSIQSRSGLLLTLFSLLMCAYDMIPKRIRRLTTVLAVAGCVAVGIVVFEKVFQMILNKIIYSNESSNGLRMLIIQSSVREAWEISPVFGLGIKRWFIPGYPLGSHSTYLGYFYKTGIFGVIVGMYIILKANLVVFRHLKDNGYIRAVSLFLISFMILLALEDVDGTNWFIVLYFSMLSILGGLPTIQPVRPRPVFSSAVVSVK